MHPSHGIALALAIGCVAACGGSATQDDGSDGAAVAACRDVLEKISEPSSLATTVRPDGPGFMVRAWREGRAEGDPDYLCRVVRDEDAARGVAVLSIRGKDGSGAYSSSLDIDLDRK